VKFGFVYDAVYPWIKGGGEKTLYELASALRDRGHECHFFGMQLWDGPVDMVREGLHYHGVSPAAPLYGPDGKRRMAQPLGFAWGLYRRLPSYDLKSFDLFDVHAFPFLSVPPFAAVQRDHMPRVPWLLTWLEVWGADYWRRYLGWKGSLGAAVERWCGRTAPHHLCISPTTGRRLQTLVGVPSERISVIPRGFAPPERLTAVPRDGRRCVVAGRLLAYKCVDVAIRAWPEVVRQLPGTVLHVVGDGPERTSLEASARSLNLADAVRFLGQLPEREQVLTEIASADLLLQPSQREGQSTVVLESLSLGTPVLAATGDETAVGDFLGPEPATSLARMPHNAAPVEWAGRIVELLRDAPLRQQLLRAGQGAVAELGWREHIAPQVEALYERVIREAKLRSR
jgi:glycosyltransferase involved in cell wall biosynthesis